MSIENTARKLAIKTQEREALTEKKGELLSLCACDHSKGPYTLESHLSCHEAAYELYSCTDNNNHHGGIDAHYDEFFDEIACDTCKEARAVKHQITAVNRSIGALKGAILKHGKRSAGECSIKPEHHAPTANSWHYTREKAAAKEAEAIILKRHKPKKKLCFDVFLAQEYPDNYEKMHRRLYRLIMKSQG